MAGLLGVDVGNLKHPNLVSKKAFSQSPLSVATYVKGVTAKDCRIDNHCSKEFNRETDGKECKAGETRVGYAHHGCKVDILTNLLLSSTNKL
jgi:hypothetical protein